MVLVITRNMWRMNTEDKRPIAFPPIHRHGVIGDRRTGAMVAADGTLNWFCVPNFDSPPLFGALLDPDDGGFCRFGPARASLGQQHYLSGTAAVVTSWRGATQESGALELTDVMAWPADERPESAHEQRIIVRRLQAREKGVVRFEVRPRWEFGSGPEELRATSNGVTFRLCGRSTGVVDLVRGPDRRRYCGRRPHDGLRRSVMGCDRVDSQPDDWTRDRAAEVFEAALSYWHDWSANLKVDSVESGAACLKRSAITVHLLSHAEYDAATAALTSSLPERIGGDRNYDYRFAWVRDASLSLLLAGAPGQSR